jgi:FkbM family methyltransferase
MTTGAAERRRHLARLIGLARSLWLYYGVPGRLWRTRRFYAQFVREGDLCFDVGAHVGSRAWVWSGLGARVVAIEPQPDFVAFLRWLFRNRPKVEVVEAAVAASPGRLTLRISRRHPTVTTASSQFLTSVAGAASFQGVRWQDSCEVEAVTLDALIARYGLPAFVKIDVEGFEAEALKGLSQPLPALSFEYLAETTKVALACVDRLEALGRYRYNVARGESMTFIAEPWLDAEGVRRWLAAQGPGSGSGDVYARLVIGD